MTTYNNYHIALDCFVCQINISNTLESQTSNKHFEKSMNFLAPAVAITFLKDTVFDFF